MLTNVMVVVRLQHMCIVQHVVYFELTQYYMFIISQLNKKSDSQLMKS